MPGHPEGTPRAALMPSHPTKPSPAPVLPHRKGLNAAPVETGSSVGLRLMYQSQGDALEQKVGNLILHQENNSLEACHRS